MLSGGRRNSWIYVSNDRQVGVASGKPFPSGCRTNVAYVPDFEHVWVYFGSRLGGAFGQKAVRAA
jgi:hypothetical protein